MNVLANNTANPFTRAGCDGRRKRMVINSCRKLKGGSSANIQIADRGFFHHLAKIPHTHAHIQTQTDTLACMHTLNTVKCV